MIPIRTSHEIDAIARAGAVVARCLDELLVAARPGVMTGDLDRQARRLLERAGAVPVFSGFVQGDAPPFPGVICTCVNDEVTHGVPGERVLAAGDLLTIDLGALADGWCADASRARVVGEGRPDRQALARTAEAVTTAAIAAIAPGVRWSTVADVALRAADAAGCRLVAGYAGHGVGRSLHEPPRAPMFPGPREDFVLWPGMVLTVEPIVVSASPGCTPGVEVWVRDDGWTVATRDGADACQVEQTVAVVPGGVRVLTA